MRVHVQTKEELLES